MKYLLIFLTMVYNSCFSQQSESIFFKSFTMSIPKELKVLDSNSTRITYQSDLGLTLTLSYREKAASTTEVIEIANTTIKNLKEQMPSFKLVGSGSKVINNQKFHKFGYTFTNQGYMMYGQMLFASVGGELFIMSFGFLDSGDRLEVLKHNDEIVQSFKVLQ